MTPVDIQRVHHFSRAGLAEMMNQVYLWELQSGLSPVASSTHSMLGSVTPLCDIFISLEQRASHHKAPLFPATLCFVKSHLVSYRWIPPKLDIFGSMKICVAYEC